MVMTWVAGTSCNGCICFQQIAVRLDLWNDWNSDVEELRLNAMNVMIDRYSMNMKLYNSGYNISKRW